MRLRSFLFVPATRPDMVAKMPRFVPDIAVVDLEDAVPVSEKPDARRLAVRAIRQLHDADADQRTFLRVNGTSTEWFTGDVGAAVDADCSGIVLPKLEELSELDRLDDVLAQAGRPGLPVIAGLESVAGVSRCEALCSPRLDAVYFGAEDFITDLGGQRTTDGLEVLYARSRVSIAARLAGVAAIDQAVVDIASPDAFLTDARQGRALGFAGKICVHPSQVPLANEAFSPSPSEIAHARVVLSSIEEATRQGSAVAVVDGQMVDDPHVRRAMAVLGAYQEAPVDVTERERLD